MTNRLVDYFVVVGPCDNEKFDPFAQQNVAIHFQKETSSLDELPWEKMSFKASILDRYPIVEYPESPLSNEIALFALPNGVKLVREYQLPSFFTFVLTGGDGARIYGCSLLFYEPFDEEHQQHSLELLVENLRKQNRNRANDVTELDAVDCDDVSICEHESTMIDSNDFVGKKESPGNPVALSANNESSFVKNAKWKKPLYISKSFCLISHYPFYNAFKTFLTELYRISITPSKLPIERYICNFLKEVPLPPQGRTQVQYTIGEKTIMLSRPPENMLPLSEVNYGLLFKFLNLDNILFLLNCILNERQILLCSSHYSLLGTIAEALTSLIYPFHWHHVYIPLLPSACIEFITAPVPFIMGTHQSFLEGIEIPTEVVTVYLDRNEIVHNIKLPPLPEPQINKLRNALAPYIADCTICNRDEQAKLDVAFSLAPVPDEVNDFNNEGKRFCDYEVRMAFFRIFVSLFQRYKHYLKFDVKEDNVLNFEVDNHFKTTLFLRDQRDSSKPFLKTFLHTQAFQRFLQERVMNENSSYIRFFEESIQAKINRSKLKLYKLPTPFLNDKSMSINNTVVAIPPDLSNLPIDDTLYVYPKFPRFNAELFNTPREIKLLVSMSDCQSRKGEAILASWKTIMATLTSLSQQVITTEEKRKKFLKIQHRKSFKHRHKTLHIGHKHIISEDFDSLEMDSNSGNVSTSISFAGAPLYIDMSSTPNPHPLSLFSKIQFDTHDICPDCNFELSDTDIKLGWSGSSQDYRTTCPNCFGKFVPRFSILMESNDVEEKSEAYDLSSLAVSVASSEHSPVPSPIQTPRKIVSKTHHQRFNSSSSTLSYASCLNRTRYEYLSPVVLKKEVENLLRKDVSADERLFSNHPLIFWNLILHFRELNIPLNILIPQVNWKSVLRSICEVKTQCDRAQNEQSDDFTVTDTNVSPKERQNGKYLETNDDMFLSREERQEAEEAAVIIME